jgi:hypothetical protein
MECISPLFLLFLSLGPMALLSAQTNTCAANAVPSLVRMEGLTERVGDILYNCTGIPNTTVTVNLLIALNTNITNRILSGNTLTGIVFTIDNGSGPQPIPAPPLLTGQNTLVYNGVPLTFSPLGALTLRVAGIRANASGIPVDTAIFAFLGGDLLLAPNYLTVGKPERALFVAYSSSILCAQSGSPLPDTINFTNLILAKTSFATTRITEGLTNAFNPRSAPSNLNANTCDRVIIRYSGFPNDARLFVLDVVAGSDAVQPTAGGDFGPPASGGAYLPSVSGSLLLSRVAGAGANGGGGTPVFVPGAIGSGTVVFDNVSEVQIVNGSAYAVYEVVDANRFAVETAQFPTFLGLPRDGSRTPSQTSEEVFFAPVSTVADASLTEPIPRFLAITPETDCGIIGDCATYLPHLVVDTPSFQFKASAGPTIQSGYESVGNTGGGRMPWTATVSYGRGNGWLSLNPYSALDADNVRFNAFFSGLTPGTYTAAVTINAGPGGTLTIPVTLVVTPAPKPAHPPQRPRPPSPAPN